MTFESEKNDKADLSCFHDDYEISPLNDKTSSGRCQCELYITASQKVIKSLFRVFIFEKVVFSCREPVTLLQFSTVDPIPDRVD